MRLVSVTVTVTMVMMVLMVMIMVVKSVSDCVSASCIDGRDEINDGDGDDDDYGSGGGGVGGSNGQNTFSDFVSASCITTIPSSSNLQLYL